MADKMVYFRMDEELFDGLKMLAEQDKRLVSQMVRVIVEDYVEVNKHRIRGN